MFASCERIGLRGGGTLRHRALFAR
jgi:hypothetical protein